MGWNSDKEPIPYLKQRVKYYKKQMGTYKKLQNDPHLLQKYGEEMLGDMVEMGIQRTNDQIKNFSEAVLILENYES